MKAIVVGCSYGSQKNLISVLSSISNAYLIDVDDIIKINSSTSKILLSDGNSILTDKVKASFIRYPYDLIPPHSLTYPLREKTEFLKSVALLFNQVAINPVQNSWMFRNRLYSLRVAKSFGIKIPDFKIYRKKIENSIKKETIVKALGNCFVDENAVNISDRLMPFLRKEQDDNDFAYIFGANLISDIDTDIFMSEIGVLFAQEAIVSSDEYRGYLVGDVFFLYKREQTDLIDKSAAQYLKTDQKMSSINLNGLKKMMNTYEMSYLCIDFIKDKNGDEFIIDINPFGSMPDFNKLPEVCNELASLLIKKMNL